MKTFNYKGFNVSIEKKIRGAFGGFKNEQNTDKYGTTEVKVFTIKFKGEEREEEFKSIPECKRFIDNGRLDMWVKLINRRKKQ